MAKMGIVIRRVTMGIFVVVTLMAAVHPASADMISWVELSTATAGNPGSASGIINLPGGSPVGVTYTGEVFFAQTNNSGTYFWNPASTFTSAEVSNVPPTSDLIALIGGNTTVNTITFSRPVVDPVLDILSLGSPNIPITYNFNAPFDILSDGPSTIYGGPGILTALPGNILRGVEGDGTIIFRGTFTSISFTVPQAENYHGFTVGLRTVPEPASFALIGTGVGLLLVFSRRRCVISPTNLT
jgi:PEP-CTERM motif